uniref:Uncharacterized protein n=1 Tax=Candidatus Kentrum sp. DK TaxID=2126562 RepID=A0A450T4L1_9GAMM|nr:MAG: hypothetical protein BECKDK2373C_GA0170839_108926 [Candidatus Kentron sp. DK]
MHLRELLNRPLSDLGWTKRFTLLCKPEAVPTQISNATLRKDAKDAFASLFQATGVPDKVHFIFFDSPDSIAQQLFLDVHGPKGFARLVFTNCLDGIRVKYWTINGWDPQLDANATKLETGTAEATITQKHFLSDSDLLRFMVTWDAKTFSIDCEVKEVRLGGEIIVKDIPPPVPELKTDEVSFEDCLMSLRAGITKALCDPLISNTRVGGIPAKEKRLVSDLAPDDKKGHTRSSPFRVVPLRSDYVLDTPTVKPQIDIIDLVRLPDSLSSLDFNRTVYQGYPVLQPEIFSGGYNEALRVLDTRCAVDFQSALEILDKNISDKKPGDQEAAKYVENFVNDQFERSNICTLIRNRASGDQLTTTLLSVPPTRFFSRVTEDEFDKHLTEARKAMSEVRDSRVVIGPPYDCMLPLGNHSTQLANESVMDNFYLLNPFVVAGSMAAKSLVMLAEAGIRQATQKENWRALEYLPQLRRLGNKLHEHHLSAMRSSLNAGTPLTLGSALYSYGFLNIHSHIDNADYRFGVIQGRNEGSAATYNAIRANLSYLNLPALSDNPSIEEVLKTVLDAAGMIKDLIDKLNRLLDDAHKTIDNLNSQITNLSDQLQRTLGQFERAGKSISIVSGAGIGFMIGGPVGAGIGAVAAGVFSTCD